MWSVCRCKSRVDGRVHCGVKAIRWPVLSKRSYCHFWRLSGFIKVGWECVYENGINGIKEDRRMAKQPDKKQGGGNRVPVDLAKGENKMSNKDRDEFEAPCPVCKTITKRLIYGYDVNRHIERAVCINVDCGVMFIPHKYFWVEEENFLTLIARLM